MTRSDLNFVVAKWLDGVETTTILARSDGVSAPRPVARLLQRRQGLELHVSVQRLPESWATPDGADHDMAALEQLYALVLHQEPQAHYGLGSGSWPPDTAHENLSHAQVLQALADLRERAVVRSAAAVAWRMVEMRETLTESSNADVVSVRATSPDGPLADVAIYFNRAPHSICTARTRADGVATCRLEDQHADGDPDDHAAAVVATFPGELRPDRVLLPTTYVLPTTNSLLPPAVTRPLSFAPSKP